MMAYPSRGVVVRLEEAMVPKILHLSDLHLGYRPRGLGDRARDHRRVRDQVLSRSVAWCLGDAREAVGAVLITGDLFESPHPEPALVEAVLDDLSRLSGRGIPVITVPGNHDELTYPDGVYRRHADRWPGTLVTRPHP
ncbi:MAG: hypothetical protein GF355_00110, partial [Candidatus Eisenbacteria bacterium]|nr:hypothetical protein [Candidatus Eisenbacteria bacterium]